MSISSDYYNQRALAADDERSRFEQAQELTRAAAEQNRPKVDYKSTPNTRLGGDASALRDGKWHPEVEGLGEPHGFFYAFDYPVSLVIPKAEQQLLKRPPQ